jgi:hypothetical protein
MIRPGIQQWRKNVKRLKARVSWLLTSAGVALVMACVLLAPLTQAHVLAVTYNSPCSGDPCGMGNGNCNSKEPNANNVCLGTCSADAPPPGENCSACQCQYLVFGSPPMQMRTCRCR